MRGDRTPANALAGTRIGRASSRVCGGPPLTCLATIRAARTRGRFHTMANIKQQRKRVRTAARERLENLRYRSTIKTLTRRLERAVVGGSADEIAAEHRQLVQLIDRAAARGALHRNAAARKKSQAARLTADRP
jgi:small subunit ribosomal protein S20